MNCIPHVGQNIYITAFFTHLMEMPWTKVKHYLPKWGVVVAK
jgi:hypothetical protein